MIFNQRKSCLLVLMLMSVLLAACNDKPVGSKVLPQSVMTVEVVTGVLEKRLQFSGVSQPVERADLGFQSSGVLQTRPVSLGDKVSKGDLLAVLENPELEPQTRAAESALIQAETEHAQVRRNVARFKKLFADDAIGEQQLEQEQTRLASLNEQIRQAKADLKRNENRTRDARLIAPFDGLIGQVNFEPGEYINAGQAVLVIGGLDRIEVVIEVPTSIWRSMDTGDAVDVMVLSLKETYLGRVDDVGTLADPATGLFPIVVSFPADPETRRGQRVVVYLDDVSSASMLVPIRAIVDPIGGAPKVYVVDAENSNEQTAVVKTVSVEISDYAGDQVAITASELITGDHVVIAGHMSLLDGQSVVLHQSIEQTEPVIQ